MKTFSIFLCSLGLTVAAFGQAVVQPPVQVDASQATMPQAAQQTAPQGAAPQTATAPFTADELTQLLGPVALYPDPLIGVILPASTVPSDVVVADRYLDQNGDPDAIPNQSWDESVKALTHFPDLLKWMDQNLSWTTQVGTAYLAQPADVMTAIQQLRARAKADGTLATNNQQIVGTDESGNITITPTDGGKVYVPQYDTDAVYNDDYTTDDGPVITYDDGWPIGPWLYYWPNWNNRRIFFGDWHRWRNFHGGGGFAGDPASRQWTPNTNRVRAQFRVTASTARPAIAQPQALPGVTIIPSRHPHSSTNASVAHPGVGLVTTPQGQTTWRRTGTGTVPKQTFVRPVVQPQVQAQPQVQQPVVVRQPQVIVNRPPVQVQVPVRPVLPVQTAPVPVQGAPASGVPAGAGNGGGAGGSGGRGGGGQWQGRWH